MKELMQSLHAAAIEAIRQSADMDGLEALRVRYLGKKGELTAILRRMGSLSAEERPVMGQLANAVRAEIETALDERREALSKALMERRLESEAVDVTLPAAAQRYVELIETRVGCPIRYVSVGPERDAIILR